MKISFQQARLNAQNTGTINSTSMNNGYVCMFLFFFFSSEFHIHFFSYSSQGISVVIRTHFILVYQVMNKVLFILSVRFLSGFSID